MMAYMFYPLRAVLLAMALAIMAQPAEAGSRTTTVRTRTETTVTESDDSSDGGVLIIAGIVGVVVVLAWVCSRIGDNRSSNVMG